MNRHLLGRLFAGLLACLSIAFGPHASAQSGPEYTIDSEWAQLPDGMAWTNTSWITADGKGNVVVLDRAPPHVRVFNRDGEFVRAWGEEEQFGSAHSVTVDSEGFFWVTDSARHLVHKFDPEGALLMTLGREGEAGDNDSRELFNQPNHVAVAPNGDIYVSDGYRNARIVHFSGDGQFIRTIGGGQGAEPGQLQLPHGVALDSRGRILVNDSDNARVSVFDQDGNFVESWPFPGRGGIVVAADDTVYISDVNAGVVNIVKDGELLGTVNADRAHGLGVDTDGAIYVSGASRMTVMKITR